MGKCLQDRERHQSTNKRDSRDHGQARLPERAATGAARGSSQRVDAGLRAPERGCRSDRQWRGEGVQGGEGGAVAVAAASERRRRRREAAPRAPKTSPPGRNG